MKKLRSFLMLLFMASALFAQSDTTTIYTNAYNKVVKPKFAVNIFRAYKVNDTSWVVDTYNKNNVLQKKETYANVALTVRKGEFVGYKNGKIVLMGRYIDNRKTGQFISFDTLGNVKETASYVKDTLNGAFNSYWINGANRKKGAYTKGERIGEWITYYDNGNVAIKETFNQEHKLADSAFFDEVGLPTTRDKIETQPKFVGGINKFYRFIGTNIRYPAEAVAANVNGTVSCTFIINELGSIEDILIDSAAHPSLGKEAVRVLMLAPKWIPATFNGKNISASYHIPIQFSLGRRMY